MIKFLDEELIDENIHEKQWKLKRKFSSETNASGLEIFIPVKTTDRRTKSYIELDLRKVFKLVDR